MLQKIKRKKIPKKQNAFSGSYLCFSAVYAVEENAEELKHRRRHHKEMEDRVHILYMLALARNAIDDGADCVGNAARDEVDKSCNSDAFYQKFEGKDHAPAKGNVKNKREFFEALKVDGVEDDAKYCNSPDYTEKHPAHRRVLLAYCHKRIGGVGSRDQNEYGAVVEYLHNLF